MNVTVVTGLWWVLAILILLDECTYNCDGTFLNYLFLLNTTSMRPRGKTVLLVGSM